MGGGVGSTSSNHSTEESSSSGSGSAGESDSLGGGRNSSPESGNSSSARNGGGDDESKFGRLSPMVLSRPSHHKLKQQLLSGKLRKSSPSSDVGYHTLSTGNGSVLSGHAPTSLSCRATPTSSLESGPRSSPDLWDVRATKTPISELHILTHNAKHLPVSRNSVRLQQQQQQQQSRNNFTSAAASSSASSSSLGGANPFDSLPDAVIVKMLSFLTSNELVKCSQLSRRFYFLAWEPELWRSITLTGEKTDTDLALKTIIRLLSRNSASKLAVDTLLLGGCSQLTDRGLAIVARRCPQLRRLEIQHCVNITNGGLMDLMTKCSFLDHLDVTGECSVYLRLLLS